MSDSKTAVYGAIVANVAIAATKFAVAGVTGSSAMLSEGVHSLVDTGNGTLLLVGLHRSKRPATAEHPFGSGKELYFWSLIVAVLIFGVGGGVSFYEEIVHMRRPEPLVEPLWNYVVLGAAFVFEGASFLVALRQFDKQRGDTPFWQALHTSKDPSNYTVLAEDSAALAGLVLAALGVFLSHRLDLPILDGAASTLIIAASFSMVVACDPMCHRTHPRGMVACANAARVGRGLFVGPAAIDHVIGPWSVGSVETAGPSILSDRNWLPAPLDAPGDRPTIASACPIQRSLCMAPSRQTLRSQRSQKKESLALSSLAFLLLGGAGEYTKINPQYLGGPRCTPLARNSRR